MHTLSKAPLVLLLLAVACAPMRAGRSLPGPSISLSELPVRTMNYVQLVDELWRTDLHPNYREATPAETKAVQALIPAILDAAGSGTIDADSAGLAYSVGMRVERWSVDGIELIALTENPDQRRGAGAYLVAVAPPDTLAEVLLEAPHSYYDRFTGRIALQQFLWGLAEEGRPGAVAFFTNTIHRNTLADGRRAKRAFNPADVCHNPEHLFATATVAAAEARDAVTVIQLHGFALRGGVTVNGAAVSSETDVVVSAGDPEGPTRLSAALAAGLSQTLGATVRLFPVETQALGATTNVEMQRLQSVKGARFVHVEMSASVRDRLRDESPLRGSMARALFTIAATPDSRLSSTSSPHRGMN